MDFNIINSSKEEFSVQIFDKKNRKCKYITSILIFYLIWALTKGNNLKHIEIQQSVDLAEHQCDIYGNNGVLLSLKGDFSVNNKIINESQSIKNSVQSSPNKPTKHKDKNKYNIQIFYTRHRSSSVGESIEIKPNRKSHNVSKGSSASIRLNINKSMNTSQASSPATLTKHKIIRNNNPSNYKSQRHESYMNNNSDQCIVISANGTIIVKPLNNRSNESKKLAISATTSKNVMNDYKHLLFNKTFAIALTPPRNYKNNMKYRFDVCVQNRYDNVQ